MFIRDPNLEIKVNQEVEDGSIYHGQLTLETGEREGYGVQVWKNGSQYDGYYLANKAHGKGKFVFANGDVYNGEWMNNKAHGQGTYIN